jgi:NADH-quinone oxidoreductase subunit H
MLTLVLLILLFLTLLTFQATFNYHEQILICSYKLFLEHFHYFEPITLTLITIITLLISIAYFTLTERKIIASVQRRRGPNVVGFWGLLQPLADGLKLVIKEIVVPTFANRGLFLAAPLITLILSFSG